MTTTHRHQKTHTGWQQPDGLRWAPTEEKRERTEDVRKRRRGGKKREGGEERGERFHKRPERERRRGVHNRNGGQHITSPTSPRLLVVAGGGARAAAGPASDHFARGGRPTRVPCLSIRPWEPHSHLMLYWFSFTFSKNNNKKIINSFNTVIVDDVLPMLRCK